MTFSILKLKFLILSFLIIHSSFGQDRPAQISWGKDMVEPSATYLSKILGSDGKGVFALRLPTNRGLNLNLQKIGLEYYDQEMNLVKAKEINLKYKKKKREFEDVLMVGKKLFLLTSYNNEAKKKNYLFAQKINRNSLSIDSDIQLIGEIDARDQVRIGAFDTHISRDSSKVLIYNKLPTKQNQPEQFTLRVYDSKLQELWTKNIILPYQNDQFSVEEYRVDNRGNVYLLGVVYEDRSFRVRRQGRPTYQYTILSYTQKGTESGTYRIDLEDQFITDLTFRIANDGDLVCSGFYSDRGTYSIRGTYFFRLNANTKEVYNKNLKKFGFEFITEYMTEAQKNRIRKAEARGNQPRNAELYQFSLDELILRSDGGAVLVAEQFYIQEFTTQNFSRFNNANINRDYYYYYNDIIVVNIRPNGEIEWSTRIPKRQETRNDGGYFSSYAMSVIRDKIFFIYNENSRNFDQDRRFNRIHNFNGTQSVIALSQINKDGALKTFPLYSNREADIITRPKISRQIGKNKMVIYGERNRRYKFGLLDFL